MKNIIISLFTAFCCGFGLSSCQEDELYVINPNGQMAFNDWSHVFESFWNAMNYSYVFWDVDSTDWDWVYAEYAPKFEGLKFDNSEDSLAALALFEKACEGLIDHHFQFCLKDENGSFWKTIYPSIKEVQSRDYYHMNYSAEALLKTVRAKEDLGRISNKLGYFFPDGFGIWSYLLDNDIVCLGFSDFKIGKHLDSEATTEQVRSILENYYMLINETPNLKGIILDLRNNRGGSLYDINYVLTPLISESVTFGYCRTKNGLGRLDYTPWSPWTLNPLNPETNEVKRNLEDVAIVALVDVNSVSMAEMTPMAIMELPNGTVVGERTYGGHGPLTTLFDTSYAGPIDNTAFYMHTSTSMNIGLDGKCREGYGVVPDIEALFNPAEFYNGNDTQLERAIEFVHTGK